MNRQIEDLLEKGLYEDAWEAIAHYEGQCPHDADIDTYKFLCAVYIEEYEAALQYARQAVKNLPYCADSHYNCGAAYELCGRYAEAYEQYGTALELLRGGSSFHFSVEELAAEMDAVVERIVAEAEMPGDVQKKKQWVDYISFKSSVNWEVRGNLFHSQYPLITKEYYDYPELPGLYIAFAGGRLEREFGNKKLEDLLATPSNMAELQRVTRVERELKLKAETDCFLPIVMDGENPLLVTSNEEFTIVPYPESYRYVNYRIPKGEVTISSVQPFRVGNMIPIEHSDRRKRLVLSIFVDGLSWEVLTGEGLAEYMPYTHRFFQKGMVCTSAHTAGDWTLPSVASVVTGQTLAKHKLLHPNQLRKLEEDTPILYEYFKAAGYNTTKIGGDWRITPNYGYARGMDRVRYGHYYMVYPVETIVSDAIEQMHKMKETDQYIWMGIGDLHMIADRANIGSLMSELPLMENTPMQEDLNSVKQDYDEVKIKYYLNQIGKVDRKLAAIFQYIEDHYSEDEILVSLFADHGQGFLVKPEEEFLSDGRSRVAFMVRGNGLKGQTDEVISTCDYGPILCKMAGIPYNFQGTDAHLPKAFGGDSEREFAICESIHVGDPYQISLKARDFTFYLKGRENVTNECRVPLREYTVRLLDKNGNDIEDQERIRRYTDFCLEHVASCMIFEN